MRRWWLKIFLFVVLAGLTAGTALLLERYQDQGPELLGNNDFSSDLAGWQILGNPAGVELLDGGVLRLTGQGVGQQMAVTQTLERLKPGQKVRLRGTLRSEDVRRGEKPWHQARLVLASYDKEGRWLTTSHVVTSLEGTAEWQPYSKTFHLIPGTATVKVSLQMHQTEGVFQARNLSLHSVAEAPWYPWLKWGILVLWLLFGVFIFIPSYFPATGSLKKGAVALVALFISLVVLGITIPGTLKSHVSDGLDMRAKVVADLVVANPAGNGMGEWSPVGRIRHHLPDKGKFAHFGLFAILAALTIFCLPTKSWLPLVTDLVILAAATEFIQFYVDGRSPHWADVAVDLGGGATGIFFASGLCLLARLKAKKV